MILFKTLTSYLYFDDRLKPCGMYKDFETALFNETLTYLQQEAFKLLKEYTEMSREEPEEFLGQLYCKLEEEHDWIHAFLPKNLSDDLVKKCKEYLKILYFPLKIEYLHRVATVREKVRDKTIFSRSWKSHGILLQVSENELV